MRFLILIFVAAALCSSCTEDKLSAGEMREILHKQNEKLGAFFKEGDADKLAAMYTDSAKLCPNNTYEIFVGKQAIRNFWSRSMKDSQLLNMETQTLTVDGNGDYIYETGRTKTRVKYQDSVYITEVKFANVWKRQSDGNYLLDVDIWNSISK
jgi:ketosteroid isomerase-like protein